MYSPKINDKYIPDLYKLREITGKAMTTLVNEAIEQYISLFSWKIKEYEQKCESGREEKCPATGQPSREAYQK